ncbi:DUF2634 domain-containing protein [Paenibacillus paeoniae]|uniref:DUF2634 domain-containing protein n=1 Tax=Paenibacillus paeoniae TaxID=2292705 RepID=A0A371PEL6_9BACL|nr:DUF2634 domain-containing protein [Paenibacillus paeoniae]REK74391.1 DUF2634 domain-containing protein [Paenibacillus paeoniae]
MIPQGGVLSQIIEVGEQPSRTWKLDVDRGRVTGMTDGMDALRQAVYKILQTDRFRHLIYSTDYGHELKSLFGRHPSIAAAEARRMLEEALTQDDRIEAVEGVSASMEGDRMMLSFTVVSQYGAFDAAMEVS